MKTKKLKGWVLPSVYSCVVVGVIALILGISNLYLDVSKEPEGDSTNFVSETIVDDEQPVINESKKIIKPYSDSNVKVGKYFYNYQDAKERQENSITYHNNTYIQNSGVDYVNEQAFDVISISDGTVTNITQDELLGNCIEIKHSDNFTAVYQSLSEVNVKKGDKVISGQYLGKSGVNELDKDMGNHLHFELYLNGEVVNPLDYIDKDINLSEDKKEE